MVENSEDYRTTPSVAVYSSDDETDWFSTRKTSKSKIDTNERNNSDGEEPVMDAEFENVGDR